MTICPLPPEEVHLWFAFPDEIRDADLLGKYREILSPEEIERLDRFRFEKHRHLFLIAHALLRATLSRYEAVDPHDWRFIVNSYGRPEIGLPGAAALRFNLSHTAGIAACAVVRKLDIGVDVEDTGRRSINNRLADRFFSPNEARELKELPPTRRRERFFEFWTLKEAYIKARGMGLSIPLDQFSFRFREQKRVQIAFDAALRDDPDLWRFYLLQPTGRHKAAIAVRRASDVPSRLVCGKSVPLMKNTAICCPVRHET